jgi:hypothetical protein
MKRIAANDGQFLFWYDLRGLGFFAQLAFALLIFSPILFTGYWISTKFVAPKSPGHIWIMAIILFALLIYALLIFLKGFIVRLRLRGNHAWILLFIPYIALICVPPVLITLPWAMYLTNHNVMLSWMLEGVFALFIYSRYNIRAND